MCTKTKPIEDMQQKKLNIILVILLYLLFSPMMASAIEYYTLAKGQTITSGTTIECSNINLTFGEAGGPDFQSAIEYPIDDTFICYTPGNGKDGHVPGGTFYLFIPKKDGLLTIGVNQNRIKPLYVEEDDTPLYNFNGITLDDSQPSNYTFSFIAKAGKTYKLYCGGSKLGFYGFTFNTNIIVANDITMTYGSDVPDLTYKYANGKLNGTPKIYTTATKSSPVGTYPIIIEKGTVTNDDIVYVEGTLTITKAPLTICAQDVTIIRHEAIPTFAIKCEGLKNDDTEDIVFTQKPIMSSVAHSNSPAGIYDIHVTGGEAPNYALMYQSGKLTILPASGEKWRDISLKREITHPQPMTGLALRPGKANEIHDTYGQCIQLEYEYYLPCEVVKGCKEDGTIIYDWSSFDKELYYVAKRGHQLVPRFRYEFPFSKNVDGNVGTTAVPDYIKQLPDYHETYSERYCTYYADWSNAELQRFTLQFYTDFSKRYAHDPRLAFIQVGFGHWAEYHINATPEYGINFPSMEYQKTFLLHMDEVSNGLPWLVSKNAGNNSPIPNDDELLALRFGLFEDSFMGKTFQGPSKILRWNSLGGEKRWQIGPIGGEVGPDYYENYNFLNPEGLYENFFEDVASKYHVTFMGGNCAPENPNGTPERVKQASMATGYRFVVNKCSTDGFKTMMLVGNEGIAPIYRDAYFAIGDVRSETSVKGLLPNEEIWIEIAAEPSSDGSNIQIVSDYILPQQEIEFKANIEEHDFVYNVSDALYIISKLEDNTKSEDEYEIKGYVTSISEISTYYGDATFVIADTKDAENGLTVYRTKGFNGELITNEQLLKVGDEVRVKGRLQRYVNGEVVIPEIASGGQIVSINGVTSGIMSVVTSNENVHETIFNLSGQRLTKPQRGLNIIGRRKVIVK